MENEAATLVGQTIAGKYAVEQLLAIGGMGAVYRARQIALDRLVALKILHRDLASDRQYVERFQIEAQAASRLDHPNSVRMFDFGEDGDGLLYIAMEYAEGRNLAVVIGQDTPLAEPRVVQLMSQVLSALAVAHEMGVVHRDLKPENIIVTRVTGDDGEAVEVAKVCDFGIAKVVPRQPGGNGARPLSTLRGVLMGTPEYMSPEQARGEEMTPASDIYSAGVVLYHSLTGQVPFLGDNPVATALKHVTDQPVRPSAHRRVNPRLEAACLKALKKDIAERFGSARDMRQALRAALPVAPETPTSTRSPGETTTMAATGATSTVPPELAITSRPTVVMPRGFGARQVMLGLALVALAGAGVFAGLRRAAGDAGKRAAARRRDRAPAGVLATGAGGRAVPEPELKLEPVAAAPMDAAGPATKPPEKRRRVASIRRTRLAQADQPEAPAVAPVEPAPPPEPAPVAVPSANLPQVPPQAAPPPPPAPAPVHKHWDVSRATVSVLEVTTSSAISVAKIRAGVRVSPLQSCYQDALRVKGTPASGVASLHIRIDVNGAVRTANLKGGEFLPAMKPCLEQAIRAARVKDIDTGDAAATIVMKFQAGA